MLREAWAPTVATPHQQPGLPAQGLFCSVVKQKLLSCCFPSHPQAGPGSKMSRPFHPHKNSCSASAASVNLQHALSQNIGKPPTRALFGVRTTANSSPR